MKREHDRAQRTVGCKERLSHTTMTDMTRSQWRRGVDAIMSAAMCRESVRRASS
jgi:hypothetical protein